ncbi:hypothetical protein C2845_PM03G07420 [Panicum miliaceum]|uniref:Uncharacterized protein n=1 Tax=Panicum miliaceum TaxID=4540 RepID=A0A3L6TAB4_PANMI|nr:hypothetical protein C2845_PM03G07420 [Panicum miliaceum]
MARESIYGASWEEAFQWQRPQRPDEPEFSRLNIDRPLPIPSVSVDDRGAHVSPARFDNGEAASSSSCFELPLELILGCDDGEEESDMPVCAAFLFDSDGVRKSVLKRSLEAGAGMEPRRPSLGKVSLDASGRISTHHVRVALESRSPAASTSP